MKEGVQHLGTWDGWGAFTVRSRPCPGHNRLSPAVLTKAMRGIWGVIPGPRPGMGLVRTHSTFCLLHSVRRMVRFSKILDNNNNKI